MKKKIILILILTFTMISSVALATGCIHTCDFSKKITSIEFLKNEASCESKPEYYYSCECGRHGDKTFFLGSATGHKFVDYTLYEQAYCGVDAKLIATCANGCGETNIIVDNGTALEHEFVDYVSNNDATCKKDATGTAVCERGCGETHTKTLPNTKVGHKFAEYLSDNNATCMSDGTKTAFCEYGCGNVDTITDVGTKIEHSYVNYIYNQDATCSKNGTKTALCEYGCLTEHTIEALETKVDHIYDNYVKNNDATCSKCETETSLCKFNCGESNTREILDSKKDHVYSNYNYNNDAKCEVDGTQTAYCDYGCGEKHTKTKEGTALSHVYTSYTYNNDAKCEVDGTETAYCDYGCGESHTRIKEGSALEHNYGKWTSNGNDTHTRVCSRDSSHVEIKGCYGGTATEEKRAICEGCGSEYGKKADHVHVYNKEIVKDEYMASQATCRKLATYYLTCACGQKGNSTFEAGVLADHSYVNYTYNNDAKCEVDGTETAYCDYGCGESHTRIKEGSALEHNYGKWTSNGNDTHTRVCSRDSSHVEIKGCYGGIATEEKRAICEGCGSEYGEKAEHQHSFVKMSIKDEYKASNATCQKKAKYYKSCECGERGTVTFEYGKLADHSYVNYTYNNDAKCEVDGTETAYCDYGCGEKHTKTKEGTALSHVYTNYTYNNDAKCEVNGTETAYCDYGCGEKHTKTKEGTAFSHVYTNYTYNNDAKCEVDGTETAYCDHGCGESHTRIKEGSAFEHNYGKWVSVGGDKHSRVCANDSSHVQTESCYGGTATEEKKAVCSACGSEYGKLLEHQHKFDKQVPTEQYKASSATCMNKATYYYSCMCGENNTITFEYGALPAHSYGEYVSNNDATCYSEGTMSAYCIYGCGDFLSRTEQGSIRDHSFTNYVSDNNATYDKDGTETAYCDFNCGQHNTRTAVGSKLNLPEYYSDDIIDIYAYSTPTHANWDGYTNNPEGLTDKVFADIANAGFTGVQALREGYYKTGSSSLRVWHNYAATDALNVMKLCEKYGLKYMIRDWAFMGSFDIFYGEGNNGSLWRTYFNNGGTIESGLEEMFSIKNVKDAVKHVTYAGHNLWDEPDIPQMEKLIPVVRKYKQLAPHGDPYFNLLPCYATNEQLGGTYAEYIDYYCKNIAPMLGYISYDYYPYSINSLGVSRVSEKYLYNFQIVAEQAKLNNLEFRLYIQAGNYGGDSRECGGVEDYRHQMYTAMAYGVRYFVYFTYGYGMSDNGLVDTNLNPTAKYYYAKQANSEVHALEDVMLNFDWQGIMYKNASKYSPNAAFNHLKGFSNVYTSHSRISDYTVSQDTVVGCFKDKENRDGFMFVNYVDPAKKQSDTVTVKFNNAKKLIVYELGVRKVYDVPANGEFTFTLSAGEGRFIIPIA